MDKEVLRSLAERFETPFYLFDLDAFAEKSRQLRAFLGEDRSLCFAMKANPFLCGPAAELADRLEVCSPGEYEICLKNGIAPEKIVVSGVNKTEESMERVVSASGGKGIYTIESPQHSSILKRIAGQKGLRLKVLLRLSNGNQFGMDKTALEQVLSACIRSDSCLQPVGIHYYSGTQKRPEKVEKELRMLDEYGAYLSDTYGLSGLELEYGPGLPVAYFESDQEVSEPDLLRHLRAALDSVRGFSHITIELGRYYASSCGRYVTKIVDLKRTRGNGYCIVDGGIHQISYFGQMMGMKRPFITHLRRDGTTRSRAGSQRTDEEERWTVCGSLCTVNDVLVKELSLESPEIGDSLVFERCGAYAVTEGMALFLSREFPGVLFYSEKDGVSLIREKADTWKINT